RLDAEPDGVWSGPPAINVSRSICMVNIWCSLTNRADTGQAPQDWLARSGARCWELGDRCWRPGRISHEEGEHFDRHCPLVGGPERPIGRTGDALAGWDAVNTSGVADAQLAGEQVIGLGAGVRVRVDVTARFHHLLLERQGVFTS